MKEEKNVKTKKPILTAVAVCLAAALVVLTFLSRTIMTANQAEVMYATPQKTDILTSREITGVVEYEDTYELIYDIPLTVIEVYVSPGDSVGTNKALMEVDARELALELRKKELAVLRLQGIESPDEFQKIELEIAEGELALFREKYPTDGKVRAKAPGTVYGVNAAPGDTMESNASLVSIFEQNSETSVVFYMHEDDAKYFDVGDSAILYYTETFNLNDGTSTTRAIQKNSSISGKQFLLRDNLYKFSIPIESGNVYHGQQIHLKITNKSPIYETVVPYDAVCQKGENEYFVYVLKQRNGLFGDEYYPEIVDVNVLFENGAEAAVSSANIASFVDVVTWKSGYLIPGESVRALN
jgi:biotin carboxyl carrier protein